MVRGLSPQASSILADSGAYVPTPIDDRRRQREPLDAVEDRCEQVSRDSHFGELERHVFRVPRHLGPDLNELLS